MTAPVSRGPAMPPSTAKLLKMGSATTCSGPRHRRATSAVAGPLAAAPAASDRQMDTKPPAAPVPARTGKSASVTPLSSRQPATWKKCSPRRCADDATT
jgi:hypothetical protein